MKHSLQRASSAPEGTKAPHTRCGLAEPLPSSSRCRATRTHSWTLPTCVQRPRGGAAPSDVGIRFPFHLLSRTSTLRRTTGAALKKALGRPWSRRTGASFRSGRRPTASELVGEIRAASIPPPCPRTTRRPKKDGGLGSLRPRLQRWKARPGTHKEPHRSWPPSAWGGWISRTTCPANLRPHHQDRLPETSRQNRSLPGDDLGRGQQEEGWSLGHRSVRTPGAMDPFTSGEAMILLPSGLG